MQKITINVDETGDSIAISVDGVKGEGCKVLTEAIERGLGTVASSTSTHEMYDIEILHQGQNDVTIVGEW
jgi:hypothetical protein